MNLKASFFTLTLFFGVVQMAFSQKDISGTVTDEDGQPLPGVNIVVEDSNKGGQTDFDGNYTIEGVEVGATLNFTFVGFQEQSVEVGDDDTIDVTMAEGSQLDEVVITGFGEEQEKVSSASTDFVKSEDLEKRKTSSALGALQGKAPGVNIRQSTGQPGAEMDINVRGKGTAGSVRPLFIIDGIVAENGLRFIDPGDIDRIDVLKDAASAAIYGARGANGVVLVTTKKGKSGKPKIDINSNIGFQENPKKLDLMNKEQYLDNLNQATENAGIDPLFSEDDRDKFADTDWQDVLFNNGEIKQNHNFRISGGEDDVKYSAGLNYYGQKGIIGSQVDHARFNRISANIKTEFEPIEDRLTVGENLTYSNEIGRAHV